jgi:hypothetical protein
MTEEQQEVLTTADTIVRECLVEYGIHTHRTKITNVIDGLKPINRRILLVQSTPNPRKVTAITGSVMEKYHPYADGAINDAITRMTQSFTTPINLLASDSNIGDYGGAAPAQPRYLTAAASNFAIDVYFKGIDKDTYEYIESESGEGVEPKFFIPKLPMALLVGAFGIGLAHKSEPPNLNLLDVCHMVEAYLRLSATYPEAALAQIVHKKLGRFMVPDTPYKTLLRNHDTLVESYEAGVYKESMVTDGVLEISPTTITIKTLPYGNKPKEVWLLLGTMLKDKKPNVINNNFQRIEDYSAGYTNCHIVLTLKRGISPFTELQAIKKLVGFTKRWTPNYLFSTPADKIEYYDPIRVVQEWYSERKRSIKAELRAGQRRNGEEIRKLQALIKIGDNIMEVVKILRDCSSVDEAYPKLCERFGLSKAQTIVIMQFKLANIPKRNHAELVADLDTVKANMAELQNRFFGVDKQIKQDCEYFIKKYPQYCERNCASPKFIGYVTTMGGIIQFETIDEMINLLEVFSKVNCTIQLYPPGSRYKYLLKGNQVEPEKQLVLPKDMVGDTIIASRNMVKYTVGLGEEDTILRINGLSCTGDGSTVAAYVGDKTVAIYRDGTVELIDSTSVTLRTNLKQRGRNTDIMYVANYTGENMVVVYSNVKNELVVERLVFGKRIIMPPKSVTKTHVLGVYPADGPIALTIPDECLSKCNAKHLLIEDPALLPEARTEIKLTKQNNLPVKKLVKSNLTIVPK